MFPEKSLSYMLSNVVEHYGSSGFLSIALHGNSSDDYFYTNEGVFMYLMEQAYNPAVNSTD